MIVAALLPQYARPVVGPSPVWCVRSAITFEDAEALLVDRVIAETAAELVIRQLSGTDEPARIITIPPAEFLRF